MRHNQGHFHAGARLLPSRTVFPSVIKRQRISFRCLEGVWGLFHRCSERIVAQILRDLRVVWGCRRNLIAFPAAEGDCANAQQASSFRLIDFQLKATASEVAPDGPRLFWYWYPSVV